ncbi:MAG: thioredoxin family protein [Planctomycetota bacterium]
MFRTLLMTVLLGIAPFTVPLGTLQAQWPPPEGSGISTPINEHVIVSAELASTGGQTAELRVTAQIAEGLHIYAASQPKPFLASRIDVTEDIPGVQSIGEFHSDREPLRLRHEQLGVDLHEYEEAVTWTAPVILDTAASRVELAGSLFAQACEAERCFAPKTYTFTASLDIPETITPASTAASDSTIASESTGAQATPSAESFSLANLEVAPQDSKSAWSVFPLAFIAGFLLNFMPCVLPVVGLKLLSFVQQANADRKKILLMNLAYTAGLMSVMLTLAGLAVFAGLGWGEQFSSAAFTVTLSAIVFAFGLSFLGVWEIPLPGFLGSIGGQSKQEGYAGAFSKGILSTLLATPCSGPFLGAALAWAVTQPTYLTFGVFFAVGLGMASPYLIVGLFPATIRFLPKPGNWMVMFKQVMGFIMLATVVYLMSFMPIASVVPTVLLLLGIGVAVWFAARTPAYAPGAQKLRAWSIAATMVVATTVVSFGWLEGVMQARFQRAAERLLSQQSVTIVNADPSLDADGIAWQNYSPELLEELIQQGRPVFVDFTADWCLTCKANEASAIETEEFSEALKQSGTVALRADKTEANPEVDELLRKLGNSAASIPFYAVFPADAPNQPVLLDGVYHSPDAFVDAVTSRIEGSTKIADGGGTGDRSRI